MLFVFQNRYLLEWLQLMSLLKELCCRCRLRSCLGRRRSSCSRVLRIRRWFCRSGIAWWWVVHGGGGCFYVFLKLCIDWKNDFFETTFTIIKIWKVKSILSQTSFCWCNSKFHYLIFSDSWIQFEAADGSSEWEDCVVVFDFGLKKYWRIKNCWQIAGWSSGR